MDQKKTTLQFDNQRRSGNDQERLLLKRVRERDRDALSQLYLLYHGRLFKFVFRLTNSYSTADELVNDIMLLVWQKASSFRGDSKVSTWIFGIAYKVTMRRVTRRKLALANNADIDELPAKDDQPLEVEDWVIRGIDALPASQQLTVMLVFYLGLSYEETAKITECPVNTVKTRMFHARRKLKSALLRHATPRKFNSETTDG